MAKEDIRRSFYRNDNLTLWFEDQKIVDSPDRVFACYNACRGLNPEHVPELVAMVERVAQLLLFDTFEDAEDRENIQRQCGTDALALLAKVKQ